MKTKSKLRFKFIVVTPAVARKFLEKNKHNRPFREGTAIEYATAMEAGEWEETCDPIRFDTDGNLSDGQHRLHAIILSGVPQKMLVVYGLASSAFDAMDNGRKRTPGDMLGRRGESRYCMLAAALAWLWRYENGKMLESGKLTRPRPRQVLKYLQQHPDIRKSAEFVDNKRLSHLASPSWMAAAHYIASRLHPKQADEFFLRLATGENLSRTSAVYKLREKLIANRVAKDRKARQHHVAAWTIKAWNSSLNGDNPGRLSLAESETFPAFK